MAPRDLKRYAQTDAGMNGMYLPFWTFDCETSTDYTGQRGERRDKSTSWYSASGHIDRFHDDVVVLASAPKSFCALMRTDHPLAARPRLRLRDCQAFPVVLADDMLAGRSLIESTLASSSWMRSSSCRRGTILCSSKGRARWWRTVLTGLSDANGSWKMI